MIYVPSTSTKPHTSPYTFRRHNSENLRCYETQKNFGFLGSFQRFCEAYLLVTSNKLVLIWTTDVVVLCSASINERQKIHFSILSPAKRPRWHYWLHQCNEKTVKTPLFLVDLHVMSISHIQWELSSLDPRPGDRRCECSYQYTYINRLLCICFAWCICSNTGKLQLLTQLSAKVIVYEKPW